LSPSVLVIQFEIRIDGELYAAIMAILASLYPQFMQLCTAEKTGAVGGSWPVAASFSRIT
jgi:hypothetical protein